LDRTWRLEIAQALNPTKEHTMNATRLLLTGSLALLGACSDSSTQAVKSVAVVAPTVDTTPKVHAPKVALIMKSLTNPFFIEMEKGARRAEREAGIELQVIATSQETAIEQQIQLIEDQIKRKVDAIIITPNDPQRLVPALKRAQDAGIKVVNIDDRLNPETVAASGMNPVPFISVDGEDAAYRAAQFAAAPLDQPSEVAILEGVRSTENSVKRLRGAERAFKQHGKLKIVASETARWKIDEGYEVARRMFVAHPKIRVVVCANDLMAIGVMKYLAESGKTGVRVAGFDALDEAKAAIRAGNMVVTVDQQSAQQGYQGVMTALKLMHGETVESVVRVEARLLTGDDLK
jgi:ribose transport system substrate-binding protein